MGCYQLPQSKFNEYGYANDQGVTGLLCNILFAFLAISAAKKSDPNKQVVACLSGRNDRIFLHSLHQLYLVPGA
jgi:hypothetical protein